MISYLTELQYKAFLLALCTLCYLAEYTAVPRMMPFILLKSVSAEKAAPAGDACCHHCPQGAKKDQAKLYRG